MKKTLSIFFLVFCCLGILKTQDTTELNSLLMRTTYKIQGDNGSLGTVFLLGKRTHPNSQYSYFVLVTARHVLDGISGDSATIFFRSNEEGVYSTIPYRIAIRNKKRNLYTYHSTADVAALYISTPINADIPLLPYELLSTDQTIKKYNIHHGDELFCLGYPFGYETNPGSFPILRSGKIASYPLTPVSKIKSFLLDFEIFKGNSGGPVYFIQNSRNYNDTIHIGETIQLIMGLVSSEATLEEKVKSLDEERLITHKLNLATIIQAEFIKETIEMLPLKK